MANTFKFGNGNWAVKDGYALAYNDENNNFKPLPFDFTRASSATTLNRQGLIETVPSGKPRIDFLDNTDGHLLLEPSRTNKLLRSNKFNTTWTLGSALSLTSDQTSTLTGNSDAWLLSNNGTSGFSALTQAVSISGSHTYSIFAKKGTNNLISLRSLSGTDARAEFNLNTGVLNSTSNTSSTEIKSYGNDWYRVSMTFSAANSFVYVYPNSIGTADAGNIYIHNAQLEAASYATSYIPTEGSSVTRVVENTANGGNSETIGSSTGTVFIDLKDTNTIGGSANTDVMVIKNSSNINLGLYSLYVSPDGLIRLYYITGNTSVTLKSGDNRGQRLKIAFAYANADFVTYVNGVKTFESSSISLQSGLDNVAVNASPNEGLAVVNEVKLYNTRLSNTELQNLTS